MLEEDKEKRTAVYRYVIVSPTFLVSDREIVARRTIQDGFPDPESTGIYITSCEHEKYPSEKSKMVRAITKQGWIIRRTEVEDKFDISMSIQNNIGGSIPLWVVNMLAGKMPKGIYQRLN